MTIEWPVCGECGRRHEPAPNNPCRSTGAQWTEDEDDLLELSLMELCAKFPTRSIAAVLSRVAHRQYAISRRYTG